EGVGVPAGVVHALAEDEVDVAAFPYAQGDAYVHLGACGAVAHGFLGGALGGGQDVDGDGASSAGDGVGVGGGGFGEFCVLGEGREDDVEDTGLAGTDHSSDERVAAE